jgi:antitoxin component of RelBE/YafQ-DinJ toxin-antitoxin module
MTKKKYIQIRISEDVKADIFAEAKRLGLSVSTYLVTLHNLKSLNIIINNKNKEN